LEKVFEDYLQTIQDSLKSGSATEHTHRPALQNLLESLGEDITVTNEPKRAECGAPDYVISREREGVSLSVGYVEAKNIGTNLDEEEKSAQLKRYLIHLPNLLLTDYLEFRWYVEGRLRSKARMGYLDSSQVIVQAQDEWEKACQLLKAFLSQPPPRIAKAGELAEKLASLTHMVRDIVFETFAKDKASQMLKDFRGAFARRLIPDLDLPEKTSEFADMFAQTITYGLFAARCNHKGKEKFKRIGAADEIPKTNPFLRSLFGAVMGPELEDEPYAGFVNDIADILADADMKKILDEFGKNSGKQDPVLHFYETFLAKYDPEVREKRGVYYTPEPVVSYIVQSVDSLLKTHFGCKQGLSDTTDIEYENEGESRETEKEKVKGPKVLILDPACGTGTFLYQVVNLIRRQFMERRDAGMWSGYVKNHLLNRLFGFEILMAPYAIAHFKLGMQLSGYDMPELFRDKWAYDFSGGERLGIYLTNTLEAAKKFAGKEFRFLERRMVEEANAAARIKKDLPIMVIIGNPPYSGHSANRSWRLENGKRVLTFIGKLLQDYYKVDGKPLDERNPKWLQDDYVKFIRWAQWRIERTGAGIIGFITNHAYLDNPTFRGMRQQLMKAFDEIYILDLHGNAKKKEVCPDGSKDENVFDIQQGVAIGLFVKTPKRKSDKSKSEAKVYHAGLWGLQKNKYSYLSSHDITNTKWKRLSPSSPFYLFQPRDVRLLKEFEKGWKVSDIFLTKSVGIVSARDSLTIQYTPERMWEVVRDFGGLSEEGARRKYDLGKDMRDWKVHLAQEDVKKSGPDKRKVVPILYRPFDIRYTYYTGKTKGFICRPRAEVMRHMIRKKNLALLSCRQQAQIGFRHIFCSKTITEGCAVSLTTREITYVFPLYLYPDPEKNGELFENGSPRHINLNPDFIAELEELLNLKFISDDKGNLRKTFGPEDVFNYIYAVFHSPTYRRRYAEFLKIDFPRVPLTSDVNLFKKLVGLGEELVALHLLESPKVKEFITSYPESGDNLVAKGYPKYVEKEKRVYINQRQYFDGVPQDVWDFCVGGYRVCEKWLKERSKRVLSFDELNHYQKVIVAISETIRIMSEIDQTIRSLPIE